MSGRHEVLVTSFPVRTQTCLNETKLFQQHTFFLGVREGTSWAMRTECDCRTLGKLKTSVTMELVTILGKIN